MGHVFEDAIPQARILSVGGGKGGIGKSTVSAGIACQLAQFQKNVVLIDADLGGANLHLSMGIRYPAKSLRDFLNGTVGDIREVLLSTTYPNVSLISGASGIHEMTNPRFSQKQKMLTAFRSLNADYIIIDVGAGADEDNTDFFSLSPNGVVIITNEPTSIENAYSFLKNSIMRGFLRMFALDDKIKTIIEAGANPRQGGFVAVREIINRVAALDPDAGAAMIKRHAAFRPRLVVNMVRNRPDIQIEERFRRIVRNYLDIDMVYAGYIVYDEAVSRSIRQITPLSDFRDAPAVGCLTSIARNLMNLDDNYGRPQR